MIRNGESLRLPRLHHLARRHQPLHHFTADRRQHRNLRGGRRVGQLRWIPDAKNLHAFLGGVPDRPAPECDPIRLAPDRARQSRDARTGPARARSSCPPAGTSPRLSDTYRATASNPGCSPPASAGLRVTCWPGTTKIRVTGPPTWRDHRCGVECVVSDRARQPQRPRQLGRLER